MTHANEPANRFACRAVLREALTTLGPLDAKVLEHVAACAFCRARVRARDHLLPLLRLRPQLAPDVANGAEVLDEVFERIVEDRERAPLGQLLAGAVPMPTPNATGWPEPLLESDLAQRTVSAPPAVAATSWARVRESILDEVAGAQRRWARRHWLVGLLGTAMAAGIVLVVVCNDRPAPPSITFQDIASLPVGASVPSIDFAVVRRGATR